MTTIHPIDRDIQERFGTTRVLVVGDLMLDRTLWGEVGRISPEAPVPVLELREQTERPGGAANVASNLRALGATVYVAGVIGDDAAGRTLCERLAEDGIDTRAVLPSEARRTTTKIRVSGRGQQLLRIDDEYTEPLGEPLERRLLTACEECLGQVDVVVLSDYAKGVLTERVCAAVIARARAAGLPVVVDPKVADFSRYAGATAITPNRAELGRATGRSPGDMPELLRAGEGLRARLGVEAIVATCSEDGIQLLTAERSVRFPARGHEVFDVCGAGDTVAAVLALGLGAGWSWDHGIEVANVAAGVVVARVGTHAITTAELLTALAEHRSAPALGPLTTEAVLQRVARWRAAGERVVFTNGCFDLLHVGHLAVLEGARRLGDRLVVGLNSDASVRGLKGPSRPVVGEVERARMLAALTAVDAVILFEQPTPLSLIEALAPDVLVKGGDYDPDTIVGADVVRARGGTVTTVPLVDGRSTTHLIDALSGQEASAWPA